MRLSAWCRDQIDEAAHAAMQEQEDADAIERHLKALEHAIQEAREEIATEAFELDHHQQNQSSDIE
jgi:hypothetical protein